MHITLDQDAVIRCAYELPPLPQSTVRLASLMSAEDVSPDEVAHVIECDPALTLKLLRIANSVYSSSNRPIGTVKEAVIRLGGGTVLGLGVGSSVQRSLKHSIPGYGFPAADYWRHSLSAAISTEAIRICSKSPVSPLAFTAALLHDIGKVVLGAYLDVALTVLLERASIEGKQDAYQAETEILSLNHAEVGALVAQHWKLPDAIVKGIQYHHEPEISDDPIAFTIHLANSMATQLVPTLPARTLKSPERPAINVAADLAYLQIDSAIKPQMIDAVSERLAVITASFA